MEREKELTLNDLGGTREAEQSLEEIMQSEQNQDVVGNKTEEPTPSVEETPEQQPEEEKISGLSLKDIANDNVTPGHIMKNLASFTEEFNQEVEEKIREVEKQKELEAEHERLEKIRQEKLEQTKFEDEIIEEKVVEEAEENKVVEDLTSIKIVKPKSSTDAFNKILARRKQRAITTSVPLANSGYIAHMNGLSSPEIRDLSIALRTRENRK